jgi:hypothetical protein
MVEVVVVVVDQVVEMEEQLELQSLMLQKVQMTHHSLLLLLQQKCKMFRL